MGVARKFTAPRRQVARKKTSRPARRQQQVAKKKTSRGEAPKSDPPVHVPTTTQQEQGKTTFDLESHYYRDIVWVPKEQFGEVSQPTGEPTNVEAEKKGETERETLEIIAPELSEYLPEQPVAQEQSPTAIACAAAGEIQRLAALADYQGPVVTEDREERQQRISDLQQMREMADRMTEQIVALGSHEEKGPDDTRVNTNRKREMELEKKRKNVRSKKEI